MRLEALRTVSQNAAIIRALLRTQPPRTPSVATKPVFTQPVRTIPTPVSKPSIPARPSLPTARPFTIPRIRAKRETSRTRAGAALNARIEELLRKLYPREADAIIEQAQSAFHYFNPRSETSAELYELYSDNLIDTSIESLGLRPWRIGRPKVD
jgi:hypothetical protein